MATLIKGKNARRPWTVRYYAENRQREKSFPSQREARAFKAEVESALIANTFVDPKLANAPFGEVAASWLTRHQVGPKTLVNYETALRLHILPVFGTKPLARVAADRDSMETFLRYVLPGKGLGPSMVRTSYMVITAIINDAIRSGRLNQNQTRLRGIKLPAVPQRAEIVFASREQIEKMALAMPEPYGFTVYLMRGCGLRLGEALGGSLDAFIDDGETYRVQRQLEARGRSFIPLKHRTEEAFRDVPVPAYVDAAIPDGWDVFEPVPHRAYREWFNKARNEADLPTTFTPHTLRHIFASVCLAGGVPITDVSKWLGHKSIQVTYGIYGHLVPGSGSRARGVLDEEWGE